MGNKIFGIGFQKTGTSTLGLALEKLGYRVKAETPRALIPILRGNYKKIQRIIDKYDALEDTPWFMIYRQLDRLYPGSKFILTMRDEENWYRSVSNHIGNLKSAHHEWIYGKGKSLPMKYRDNAINVYLNHNREVIEYFRDRPEDFLIVDFTSGDGWEKICAFLGKDIPDETFPHLNKTDFNPVKSTGFRRDFKIFRKRIKNHFKILLIKKMGYLN